MAYLLFEPKLNALTVDLHRCSSQYVADILRTKLNEAYTQGVTYVEVVYGSPNTLPDGTRGATLKSAVMHHLQKSYDDFVVEHMFVRVIVGPDENLYLAAAQRGDIHTGILLRLKRNPTPVSTNLFFKGFTVRGKYVVDGYTAPTKNRVPAERVPDGFDFFFGIKKRPKEELFGLAKSDAEYFLRLEEPD